ncbi:MAG: pirin family protein [Deltaproteobacteria bacterium]|nr:MAG: pirin family protein [Deltaproteobacteria bacterium]
MQRIRRADERGHADHGWLDTHHTFSFADYYDRAHMGFGHLRVINDDRVAAGTGFGAHPHRDMEIVTYVLSGAVAHRDSMGHGSVIRPGEVQLMSAGSGVYHSEMNPSPDEPLHLLQIWILPRERGGTPGYAQRAFPREPGLLLVVSEDGRDGSLPIKQDARIYRGLAPAGTTLEHTIRPGRRAWVHVASGDVEVAGQPLTTGDGLATDEAGTLTLTATSDAELLVFDLA